MKKKQIIRLTEQDLHQIIEESVNKVLNEIGDTSKGQYMLGRLHGRQINNGQRDKAMNTMSYSNKQLANKFGGRKPDNFDTYDAYETANHLGYVDETNPQLSKDMVYDGSSIGNYQANVRSNYLRGVSKF